MNLQQLISKMNVFDSFRRSAEKNIFDYLEYKANISITQFGTLEVCVLNKHQKNYLGDIKWSYEDVGYYIGELDDKLIAEYTIGYTNLPYNDYDRISYNFHKDQDNDGFVHIQCVDCNDQMNRVLFNPHGIVYVEIKVKNFVGIAPKIVSAWIDSVSGESVINLKFDREMNIPVFTDNNEYVSEYCYLKVNGVINTGIVESIKRFDETDKSILNIQLTGDLTGDLSNQTIEFFYKNRVFISEESGVINGNIIGSGSTLVKINL